MTSQTKWAVSSPTLRNRCGVPAGTTTRSPGRATIFLRAEPELELAGDDLEALLLRGMDVRRGDGAVRA